MPEASPRTTARPDPIWRNVPADFTGVWEVHLADGAMHYGAFRCGTLDAEVMLDGSHDPNDVAAFRETLEVCITRRPHLTLTGSDRPKRSRRKPADLALVQ